MDVTEATLLLLTLLFTKHLVIDFMAQTPWQYLNKGTYGHMGGVVHASLHGAVTGLIVGSPMIGLVDAVVHYHVDWLKVQLCNRYYFRADNSKYYWWLLGLDQWLHSLTYIGIALWMLK